MISVLVAFIILLIGIAGFSKAITTANDMVRRAEMLNAATGKVLADNFYPNDYAVESAHEDVLLDVYEGKGPGGTPAFQLHGQLIQKDYPVTITQPGTTETESMTYSMYFYK